MSLDIERWNDSEEILVYQCKRADGSVIYQGACWDREHLDFYLKGHPSVHSVHVRTFQLQLVRGEVQTSERTPALLATWGERNSR